MYVLIHRPHVYHAVCVYAYRNLVKIINIDYMSGASAMPELNGREQPFER